jgi:hypothetical protein
MHTHIASEEFMDYDMCPAAWYPGLRKNVKGGHGYPKGFCSLNPKDGIKKPHTRNDTTAPPVVLPVQRFFHVSGRLSRFNIFCFISP